MESSRARSTSFGERGDVTAVDRFGVWLSKRQIERRVGPLAGLDVADIGCGYDATFMRHVLDDVALGHPPRRLAGPRPRGAPEGPRHRGDAARGDGQIEDASLDVVLCMSVVEHLWEPDATLAQFAGCCARAGSARSTCRRGGARRALEFSAFRLGTSPFDEMDDHKTYYDPRDLWPLLVRAGFRPHAIRCFKHKFGLNTFAVCRTPPEGNPRELHPVLPRRDRGDRRRARHRAGREDRHRPRPGPRRAGGPTVHHRRGRLRGPRRPRRQRLPQDLRHRVVRPHRQRLRADRPHQRRGLGHHVLRVARRARGSTPTTPCSCSRWGAATRRRTSRPTSSAPSSWPRSAAPRSSGSSAATAARRPSTPRRARSCRRCTPTTSPRTPRASAPSLWHLLVTHPALAKTATKWESLT